MTIWNLYTGLLALVLLCLTLTAEGQQKSGRAKVTSDEDLQTIQQAQDYLDKQEPLQVIDLLSGHLKMRLRVLSPQEESRIFLLIGMANHQLAQYDLAIQNYQRALSDKSKYNRKINLVPDPQIFRELGNAYFAKKEFENAESWYRRYNDNTSAKQLLFFIEGQLLLGKALLASGKSQAALDCGLEAQAKGQLQENDSILSEITLFLGEVYEQQQNYEEGLSVLLQSNELATNANVDDLSKNSSAAIGRVLRAKEDPEGELAFKEQELSKSISQNDLNWQNTLNLDIAEIYINMDKSEEAVPYLKQSVQLSEQLGTLQENIDARKSLSSVYAAQGDYGSALANYREYVGLVDQLYDNKQKEINLSSKLQQDLFEKQSTISLMEKDRALSENQILLLEAEQDLKDSSISRQRLLIYGLLLLVTLVLVSAYLLYKSMMKKRRVHQLLALKSLRSQMNPHFIFNALNSVNGFISQNDRKQANKYLADFSKLMRTVMENSQKDFVPLEEEIATLKLYLKLEHHRFHDKFEYELTISDTLDMDQYRIPPMLIQPYIENAIWHGLRYKEGVGLLEVSIENGREHLIMKVEDNGIGRKKSQELKTRNQKTQTSMGMRNIKDRIKLLNETYQTSITYLVEDRDSQSHSGTCVTVKIPRTLVEEIV